MRSRPMATITAATSIFPAGRGGKVTRITILGPEIQQVRSTLDMDVDHRALRYCSDGQQDRYRLGEVDPMNYYRADYYSLQRRNSSMSLLLHIFFARAFAISYLRAVCEKPINESSGRVTRETMKRRVSVRPTFERCARNYDISITCEDLIPKLNVFRKFSSYS